MKKLSILILSLIQIFILVQFDAEAKRKVPVLKFVSSMPQGSPWDFEWNDYEKLLQRKAKRKIKIQKYLGGSICSENCLIRKTIKGYYDIAGGSITSIANFIPALNALHIPYLFDNIEEAKAYLFGPGWTRIEKILKKHNITMFSLIYNGYRNLFYNSSSSITDLKGLKALKMRAQKSKKHIEIYRLWNAMPVPISMAETINAIQTGMLDGFDHFALFAFTTQWTNSIKYILKTEHIFDWGFVFINNNSLSSLPQPFQDVFKSSKNSNKFSLKWWNKHSKLEKLLLKKFTKWGIKVDDLPMGEKGKFAKKIMPLREKLIRELNPEGKKLYQHVNSFLKRYREKRGEKK